MRRNLFARYVPVMMLFALLLCACNEKSEKTIYTHAIPPNATEVAAIRLQTLVEKTGLNETESQDLQQKLTALLLENGNQTLAQEVERLWQNPSETGIDWKADAYLFHAPSLHNPALALKIDNIEKLEKLFATLAGEQLCTSPAKVEGYRQVEISDVGLLLAYNDGTLLAVYGDSPDEVKKLQPAITSLMKQTVDKSIHANPHFESTMKQNGDIVLLATPEVLPFNVRGILSWPSGTQLSGYLLFENGRIYARLQQADFDGETQESNQPFHPKNSRELQQSMMAMMRGTPFNIELTSDELLTLSNLRVLMEFAPNEPEIQALYQLIMQIESLNVRGDRNRTTFTLVLKEKNQNALKQIVDFARQFVGQ